MPSIVSKNLGLVRAIHSGTTAPTNIKMLWYNENDFLLYYYDVLTTTWKLLISGGGGGTQTLAQTLALGNVTGANDLKISNGRKLIFNDSGFTTSILANTLTGNTNVYLPTTSGTLALLSDLPSLAMTNNFVVKGTGSGITSGSIFDNGNIGIGVSTSLVAKLTVKSTTSVLGFDVLKSDGVSNFSVHDDGSVSSRLGYWVNMFGNRKAIWTPDLSSFFVGIQSGQGGGITPTATANSGFGHRSLYSITSGYNNVSLGFDSLFFNQSGVSNVGVGASSLYNIITGNENIGVGFGAGSNIASYSSRTISIGGNSIFDTLSPSILAGIDETIVIGLGNSANASESGEAIIGGSSLKIKNLYIGQGRWSDTTTDPIKFQITSPISNSNNIGLTPQTNASGVDFIIAGSQPTGSGNGGSLLFQIAPGGGGSGTAARPLVTTLKLTSTKSIIAGSLVGTTSTDGFVYISTSAGIPTGTPTTQTGTAPLIVDTNNNRLYFYSGGVWNYSSGGGTTYSNGVGLNLIGTTFSIATSGVVNSMIANSTIDLTSKVTGILPYGNGGTGFSSYTKGDLLLGNTGGSLVKLGIGSSGEVLTVSGGTAVWSTASSLGALSSGQIYLGNASNATALVTPSGDITISNTGVTAIGNSKVTNAMIVAMAASKLTGVVSDSQGGTGISSYTTGDLLYYGVGSFSKLGIGTAGQSLIVNPGGTAPIWGTPTISGYVKTNGTTPMTANWNAGLYTATFNTVTIGDVSIGLLINGSQVGANITATGDGIQINSGLRGIVSDGEYIGGQFNSINYAGKFIQNGILGNTSISDVVTITRDLTLNGFTATGSLLYVNDLTASTGNLFTINKQGTDRFVIASNGALRYNFGTTTSGYVLTTDSSGNATWQAASGGGSYTFSTGLTGTTTITADISTGISGGQTAIGGTAASENLILSSTSHATKGYVQFGTGSNPSIYRESLGYLGIGCVPTSAITLNGSAARNITIDRNPTAATAGQPLFIFAGGGYTSGTNLNGGTLYLCSGVVTGTGNSEIQFRTAKGAASGTSDTQPVTVMTITGTGKVGVGTTSPTAYHETWIPDGSYGIGIINKDVSISAAATVGWGIRPATNSTSSNLIFYELAPTLTNRFTIHKGGNVSIGAVPSGDGDARLHVIGTFKLADSSQGTDKILRSDSAGLASWITAPWLTSPMTTIADIIQASATVAGGSPARLAGSATAGTFLRSQGTGVVNHWSTLVLPNSATAGQIVFAPTTNNYGGSANLTYTSDTFNVTSTTLNNDVSSIASNTNNGTASRAIVQAGTSSSYVRLNAYSAAYTGYTSIAELAGSSPSSFDIVSVNSTPIKLKIGSSEIVRITSSGLFISQGVGVSPDASCLVDLNSTTQGLRVPRMSTSQRNAINITAKPGIIVYDTDTNLLYVSNSSTAWVSL